MARPRSLRPAKFTSARPTALTWKSRPPRCVSSGGFARELVEKYPDPQTLARKEHLLIQLSRIATELFTMCAVLARTSSQASADSGTSQDLADVFCTDARDRLAQLWRQLTVDFEPNHARLSQAWLTGPELDYLVEH
jgi:hypothetical protein